MDTLSENDAKLFHKLMDSLPITGWILSKTAIQ